MAALNRPTNATYTIHESVTVDTTDREDHTFCGIMFPIKAKRSLPIHQIVINSLSIRGRLGPITVWVTKDEEAYRDEELKRLAIEEAAAAASSSAAAAASAASAASDPTSSPVTKKSKYNLRARFSRKSSKSSSTSSNQRAVRPVEGQISMRKRDWIKIYEKEHGPSFRTYTRLDLSAHPIILRPGEVRGVYIHSTLEGDEAIVYDNKHQRLTHDDPFLQILTGRAHVSERPFGKMPIWGWGNAWRDAREFVGQVSYGAVYRLWNPSEHLSFGSRFQRLALTLFGCQRRLESPMARLSDDIIFYILNMLKWDWARDDVEELASEQKKLRKMRRRKEALLAATAAASVSSEVPANAKDDGAGCCSGAAPTVNEEEEDDRKPAAIVSPDVGSTRPRQGISSDDEMRIDSSFGDDEAFYEDEYHEDDEDGEDDSDDDSDEYDSDDYDDYRGIDPTVFHYRDYEEEDSDDEAAINEEQRLRDAEARRRSWMRSQFARIHVLNALASMNDGGGAGGHDDMEVDSDGSAGGGGAGHYGEDDDSDYIDG